MKETPCKMYVNRLKDGRVRLVLQWESGQFVPVYLPLHLVEQLGEGLIRLAREVEDDQLEPLERS